MPRNMSFAMTPTQILAQTKTVTRRQGWNKTKVNEEIQPVEKGMGLKKGEKVNRLGCPIILVNVRNEPINRITQEDVVLEGFPWMTPAEFVEMYCSANKVRPDEFCNRIEFKYKYPLLTVSSPPYPSWLIWSWEHRAWWAANACGYVPMTEVHRAGKYTLQQANEITNGANRFMKPGHSNEQMVPLFDAPRFLQDLLDRYETHGGR